MSRRATQADVARMAGVSQATVSLVLNGTSTAASRVSEDSRRRVLAAMERVGYAANPMAQSLARGRSRLVGVFTYESVFPGDGSDFYHPFLVGIEGAAEAAGVDLLLFTSAPSDGGQRRLSDAGWNRLAIADGCILIGRTGIKHELASLQRRNYPMVFIGRRDFDDVTVPYVGADYAEATRSTAQDLFELGHTRVAFIGDLGGIPSARDRVEGYRAACEAVGNRPILIDWGAFDADEYLDVLATHSATAVLLGSQVDLGQFAGAASRRGVAIPEDLSVAVLGEPESGLPRDRNWSGFRIPRQEMGRLSFELLRGIVTNEPDLDLSRLLPCQIVEGDTTAQPQEAR